MSFKASYVSWCPRCGEMIQRGDYIEVDPSFGRYCHAHCPTELSAEEAGEVTLDERYNGLCQKLDRIMTGNPNIRVRGGARSAIAQTLREEASGRAIVEFDHHRILEWSHSSFDRTALTLALNLHELSHIWHTPANKVWHPTHIAVMHNWLEDQRIEMLTALSYPKAVDYFRFLNTRALKRGSIDGRAFLLYYGRRHLFPKSVNGTLREMAVKRYDPTRTAHAERLITEYQLLMLPEELDRSWAIAEELAMYDDFSRVENDLRHDCEPQSGKPSLKKAERDKLHQRLVKVLARETKTPEPIKDEPIKDEPTQGQPDAKQEPGTSEKPEALPETEPTTGQEPDVDNQPEPKEESLEQAGGEPADEQEPELEEPAEAGSQDDAPEDGSDTSSGEDGEDDTDKGGKSGGLEVPETDYDPPTLTETLDALENDAIEQIEDEVEERHEALKASELPLTLGGSRRGPLDLKNMDSARRLAHLFQEINQDLLPSTKRAQKRGRLDVRRVSVALAANSARMFKRRQPDLSRDAAMAVHIMVDVSSSMFGVAMDDDRQIIYDDAGQPYDIHDVALAAGFTLAKGVELAGHMAKVTTYDTRDKLQKNWLDQQYRERIHHGGGGTDPTSALRKARADFLNLTLHEDIHNHVLIIVTDGAWAGNYTGPMKTLAKDGVRMIVIGIGMMPKEHDGVWKTLTTPTVHGLSAVMSEPLRKLAIEITREVRRKVSA